MSKCIACGKEIPETKGILLSCDGDFVCDDKCEQKWRDQCDKIDKMSDKEFDGWLWGMPPQ